MRANTPFLILALALSACRSDSSPNPARDAFAETPKTVNGGAAVAIRFPARGSAVRLHRLPSLAEVSWQFQTRPRATERIIGFASDADLVFSLTDSDSVGYDLVALDLITGRSRTIDSGVVAATLGPTGTAYVVHADSSVAEIERRSVVAWPDTLHDVTNLWGAARGRILVATRTETGRELVLLGRGQTRIRQTLPEGSVSADMWGRLVGVATDSGLALLTPDEPDDAVFLPLTPPPSLMILSASGHRIYVLLGQNELAVYGRFGEGEIRRSPMPGPVADLRVDPLGRIILAAAASGDSVWVLDAADLTLRATVAASWDEDMPTVAPDGTVLVRSENRIVALDRESFDVVASENTRSGERWLIASWDPRRPALELAADTMSSGEDLGQLIYVQVSSSGNPAWAEDLAQELRGAGLNSSVLPPDSAEERFRVVLGPYPTREDAEENGRRLGRPFWILIRDTVPQIQ